MTMYGTHYPNLTQAVTLQMKNALDFILRDLLQVLCEPGGLVGFHLITG